MMRSLLLTVLATFLILTLNAQVDPTAKREQIVKSKIRSITVMGHKFTEEGDEDPVGIKKTHEMFDEKGNKTRAYNYYKNASIKDQTMYRYNSQGKLSGVITKDGNDKILERYMIKYDAKGNESEKLGEKDGKAYHIKYDYKNGLLTKKTKVDANDSQVWQYVYEYNTDGKMIKEKYLGKKNFETHYFYNNKGLMTRNVSFADTIQGYTYLYEYDDKGNKIREEQLDGKERSMNVYKYIYQDNGKVSVIELYSNYLGYLSQKWVYRYDGDGNIEQIKIFDKEEGLPVFNSKYIYRYRK